MDGCLELGRSECLLDSFEGEVSDTRGAAKVEWECGCVGVWACGCVPVADYVAESNWGPATQRRQPCSSVTQSLNQHIAGLGGADSVLSGLDPDLQKGTAAGPCG